jgi:hypothetical protein
MLEFCLLALPWAVDQTSVKRIGRDSDAPLITCARPEARMPLPSAVHAMTASLAAPADEIGTWLSKWERATRRVPERGRSQREEFRRSIHQQFNEHTAAAAERLVGHVNAESLREAYDWRIVERTRDRVCLEGIPQDETDRLFYGSLRVVLHAGSGRPHELAVVARNEHLRTVWRRDRPVDADPIQLAGYESDIPPAPKPLPGTVSMRFD